MKGLLKTIIFIVVLVVAGYFVVKYVKQYMGAQVAKTAVEGMQQAGMEK